METGLFDKLQDAVVIAGKELMDAAEDFSGKAKLRYEIRTRESYLEELYTELGKKYYADHKGEEREEGSSFEEIDKLLAELSELREDLANRKGASPCPRCGAEVALDADYCSKCGAFLHEED